MKRIVLTFDYELFFGNKCGTVGQTLIEPTNKILSALKRVDGRGVFFVDYLMLKRMLNESEEMRLEAVTIEKQLREIVQQGSRIELHLHPHWVDAKYRGGGKWDFSDYGHYCLDSFPQAEVTKMFVEGVDYLNGIARQVDPNYQVSAFRAGGWAITPFNKLRDAFCKSGIWIDSSICKGMTLTGVNYRLDFTKSPREVVYRFSNDVMAPDPGGRYCEVQIGSFAYNPFSYLADMVYRKLNRPKFRHQIAGSYMKGPRKAVRQKLPLWRRLTWRFFRRVVFSLDVTGKWMFLFHLLWSRRDSFVVMAHPKDYNDLMIENIVFLGGKRNW